ncbi:LLM class flavin-dependent oxidoreductase [Streptomyces noursei]|uniref:LLM class flavin-dependent oxidoreductase n=1 Tax=Streptomyces noursei TaxID=1971 RepID=UPI00167295FD|nr:LLM class flavin-dependent oxidoreductase [Streptomyces noursei]MCZ1018669.1 LLM class flavin-dependent oxidoreductase [Streptomyces noursei]GGX26509.1 hypothetical protein GCM10010341_54820 [Streptomyces noursei]
MRGRGALGEHGARALPRTGVLFGGSVSAAVERVARRGDGFLGAALPSQQVDGVFRDVEATRERTGRPRPPARVDAALRTGRHPSTGVMC